MPASYCLTPFPEVTVPRERFPPSTRQSNYETVLPYMKVPNSQDDLGACRQSSSFLCFLLWQFWVQSPATSTRHRQTLVPIYYPEEKSFQDLEGTVCLLFLWQWSFLHFKHQCCKNSAKKPPSLHKKDVSEFCTYCGKRQSVLFQVDDDVSQTIILHWW